MKKWTNKDRISAASVALKEHIEIVGDNEDLTTDVSDLFANLFHLLRSGDCDIEYAIRTARNNFMAEIKGGE